MSYEPQQYKLRDVACILQGHNRALFNNIASILLSKTILKRFVFEGYFRDSGYEYYITVYITVKVNGNAARNGTVRPCHSAG